MKNKKIISNFNHIFFKFIYTLLIFIFVFPAYSFEKKDHLLESAFNQNIDWEKNT